MSLLRDFFTRPLYEQLSNKEVHDAIDQGAIPKGGLDWNPRSDRYTYGNLEDANYDKDWVPTTPEEKETLTPDGYHRVGARQEVKAALKGDMSEKDFDEAYAEKQISIDSTAFDNVHFDEDENMPGYLIPIVTFKGNKTRYRYRPVPIELIEAWMKAPSKGEFFMEHIHDQYSYYGSDHSPKGKKDKKALNHHFKQIDKMPVVNKNISGGMVNV